MSWGGANRAEEGGAVGGQRAARLVAAELTYIDLTENNVNYAANHNQGVEHIPGVAEIALSKARRVVGKSDQKRRFI